jgi:hypothetical protein
MTAQQYLNNRITYQEIKRKGTGRAQKEARNQHRKDLMRQHTDRLRAQGIFGEEALKKATEKVDIKMNVLHALHNPDLIAGGMDTNIGIGNSGVNQSIGKQWGNRVNAIDEQAKQAVREFGANAQMNIKLHRCK